LNKNRLPVEALSNSIRQLSKPNQDLVIVLNADGSVTHDRVVAVMDQIRQVEGTKLAIATQRR
jgi:biopolymer transport protein ExbD